MNKHITFIGTCVNLNAKDLDNFDDSARQVSYRTFRKHLGKETVDELNNNLGIPLHKDWAVRFYVGKWKGKKAICLMHSCIHHIWTIE